MDFIGTLIAGIFVAILIAFALTFGMALLGALFIVALIMAAIAYSRQLYYRWRFMDGADKNEQSDSRPKVKIIEAEYTEIRRED